MHLPFECTETYLENAEAMRHAMYLTPLTPARKKYLMNTFALFLEISKAELDDLYTNSELSPTEFDIEVKQYNCYLDILKSLMEMIVVSEQEAVAAAAVLEEEIDR